MFQRSFDCTACGACCYYFAAPSSSIFNAPALLAPLEDADMKRFTKKLQDEAVLHRDAYRNATYLCMPARRLRSGRWVCKYFKGRLGGPCECTIYKKRPNACREFVPGEVGCHESRTTLGIVDKE